MPLAGALPCSLVRHSSLLSKTLRLFHHHHHHHHARSLPCTIRSSLRHNIKHPRPMTTTASPQNPNPNSTRSKKKTRQSSPEHLLRHQIGLCSKTQDLPGALRLFESALKDSVPLNLQHYNSLLYLCSLSPSSSSRGFEIYDQMLADKITPNEATFTSLARLAANADNAQLAFNFIRRMKELGMPPRLRSYGPALFGFCEKGNFEKAREVEMHMDDNGVVPEEAELGALLKVSAGSQRGDEVYRILHRMRSLVRRVGEGSVKIMEEWFRSEEAERTGKWSVGRSEMDADGVCKRCGERLVCIDIDPDETEEFARKLANLACDREVKADFVRFQEWLEQHGPFDAVVDGANVGLFNQHNFSFFQLNSAVNGLRQMSPSKKLPLIVLHSRRVKGGPADNPNNKKLLETWRRAGALYATPTGSNDDWYWLYAAVNFRSLLVTNDEMRDHLFELLGTSFFPRWKEKHQVRLTFSKRGANFHMPPPYSIVIQESERGSWHIPTISGDDIETPRQWVCVTRNLDAVSSLCDNQLAQINL